VARLAVSAQAPTLGRLLGSWTLDPGLAVLLLAAAACYLAGARRTRRPWPAWRCISWLLGLLALAAALMSGIDRYSELLLSVHMLQHLLLMLIAPALLLCAAPIRLALAALPAGGRRGLGRLLQARALHLASRPALGFAVFAAVTLGTHLSGLYELALREPAVHVTEHAAYFFAGALLLAPLLAVDPLPRPANGIARFCWSLAAMVAMAIPGALLTFATRVRYPHYLAPARALGRSALADQQLAGVIMWIGGGLAMFALALAVAMRAMILEERRQRRRETHAPPLAGVLPGGRPAAPGLLDRRLGG
jgi:putative membrane protein